MSDPVARYEFLAQRFRRDTGLMSPGKDAPACVPDNLEERRTAWDAWLKSPQADMARGAFEERAAIVGKLRKLLTHDDFGTPMWDENDLRDLVEELERS